MTLIRFERSRRRKALLIANPKAGAANAGLALAPAVEALSGAGFETLAFTTCCRGDAFELSREYGGECERLVCIGGDGTVNEVVRGVMMLEKRPSIGYIPMGSTNDFAKALGLPKQRRKQIETAVAGEETPIDVGCFNGRHYACLASFGAFTDIGYSTNQSAKNVWGFMAYLGGGLSALANIKPIRVNVTVNGRTYSERLAFASVSNTPSIIGVINYNRKRKIDLNDGLFEVMLIRYPENALDLSRIAHALTTGDFGCDLMQVFVSDRVRFEPAEPVDWMLDGEHAEAWHEAEIRNVHSAIKMMLPKRKGSGGRLPKGI